MEKTLKINTANIIAETYNLEVLESEFMKVSNYVDDLGKKIDKIYTQRLINLEVALGKKGKIKKEYNNIDLDVLNHEYIDLKQYLHLINLQANYLYKKWFDLPK